MTRVIVKAIGMDMSARQTLKMYREAGGNIRTQDFLRLWNIVADSPRAYGTKGIVKSERD